MLTIRGRLITPFVLGSMSVGLNILIRHSFMDLWFWITALVPWPQLLFLGKISLLSGTSTLYMHILLYKLTIVLLESAENGDRNYDQSPWKLSGRAGFKLVMPESAVCCQLHYGALLYGKGNLDVSPYKAIILTAVILTLAMLNKLRCHTHF